MIFGKSLDESARKTREIDAWRRGAGIRAMKRICYAVRRAYRNHCRSVGVLAPIEHRPSTN